MHSQYRLNTETLKLAITRVPANQIIKFLTNYQKQIYAEANHTACIDLMITAIERINLGTSLEEIGGLFKESLQSFNLQELVSFLTKLQARHAFSVLKGMQSFKDEMLKGDYSFDDLCDALVPFINRLQFVKWDMSTVECLLNLFTTQLNKITLPNLIAMLGKLNEECQHQSVLVGSCRNSISNTDELLNVLSRFNANISADILKRVYSYHWNIIPEREYTELDIARFIPQSSIEILRLLPAEHAIAFYQGLERAVSKINQPQHVVEVLKTMIEKFSEYYNCLIEEELIKGLYANHNKVDQQKQKYEACITRLISQLSAQNKKPIEICHLLDLLKYCENKNDAYPHVMGKKLLCTLANWNHGVINTGFELCQVLEFLPESEALSFIKEQEICWKQLLDIYIRKLLLANHAVFFGNRSVPKEIKQKIFYYADIYPHNPEMPKSGRNI